jgi:hypothetical protein
MATDIIKDVDLALPKKGKLKAAREVGQQCGLAWFKEIGRTCRRVIRRNWPSGPAIVDKPGAAVSSRAGMPLGRNTIEAKRRLRVVVCSWGMPAFRRRIESRHSSATP